MSSNHISTVRAHLLATLADLRSRDNPMDIDRARAVADVARVLVDTAKVEVDYIKATGQDRAGFLEAADAVDLKEDPLPNGITSITRHRLEG